MLSFGELLQPLFMAASACFCCHGPQLVDIVRRFVAAFVAVVATYILSVVTAYLPVDHDITCFLYVAVDAIVGNDQRTDEC